MSDEEYTTSDAEIEEDEDEEDEDEGGENYPDVTIDGKNIYVEEPWELECIHAEFPDASNGVQSAAQERAPLGWANSAAIYLDRKEDSITLSISVGDPRGAFTFTVRRISNGSLVMHVPYPEEGLLHMPLTPMRAGTYKIGH